MRKRSKVGIPEQKADGLEGPSRYADETILCALMIRAVFHCKLRQLEGFLKSLIHLMGLDLETPHYSLICRRAKKLEAKLKKLLPAGAQGGEHIKATI